MKKGMKILVAYDGSPQSKDALKEATDLLREFSGEMTVLHVYWDPEIREYDGTEIRDRPSLRLLDDIKNTLDESCVKYKFRSEHHPNTPRAILNIAENEKYDMIALGSRGIGRARAWLLGSVSNKVVSEAPCTVLVTK